MDFPKPPQDIELKNIIDKLAQFVARNGPDFEEMTKNKQTGNPKFDFLFGGEYYHYYKFKVNSEQTFINAEIKNVMPNNNTSSLGISVPTVTPWMNTSPNDLQTESLTAQQVALNDQIRESETNLNAQHEVMLQQQEIQIQESIAKAQESDLRKDATDCGIDFSEFDNVLQPIIDTCTKDAISAGKSWIIQRATAPTPNAVIANYLLRQILSKDATFSKRLHIIYLLNDTLHHCLRRNADELKKALEDVVVPMFCSAALNANDEQSQKLQKLLNLWENKNHYFSKEIIDKLKNPSESLVEYKAQLLEKNPDIVEQITSTNKSAYQHYQTQHQAFVNHALQQIQSIEKQKQAIEQRKQQLTQNLPHPPAVQVPMPPLNNVPSDVDSKNREMHRIPPPAPQQPAIPSLMQIPVSQPPNFDPRPTVSLHNQLGTRGEQPLSERLAHMMPTPTNHDPRLQNNQYRSQNSEPENHRFHQSLLPNTQEPPPPPPPTLSSFKKDSPLNHVNSNFQDRKPEINIPPPPSQLPFNQPPPNFAQPPLVFPPPDVALPDLSRPPPNFAANTTPPPPAIPPLMSLPPPDFLPDDLLPSLPYYDLPAGLMVPLVKLEDFGYKPLNPEDIRLPPPAPPSERLLAAVKAFYTPPGHDRPRDSEGWEKLGLYEYYRAKSIAKQQKVEDIASGVRAKSRSVSPIVRPKSRSRSPLLNRKRYRSRSRSKSKGRGSRSPPRNKSSNRRSSPRRSNRDRRRDRSRSASPSPHQDIQRSPTPPSFLNSSYGKMNEKLDESNKGHQLLRKMGWGGAGLGAKEQGIEAPINAGEVRDRVDQYKGVGINLSDPYENFRKSKGQAFITRMKERAEERLANSG